MINTFSEAQLLGIDRLLLAALAAAARRDLATVHLEEVRREESPVEDCRAWLVGVAAMKVSNRLLGAMEVACWLPRVGFSTITLPLDVVPESTSPRLRIQNLFDFVLLLAINDDGWRGWRSRSRLR